MRVFKQHIHFALAHPNGTFIDLDGFLELGKGITAGGQKIEIKKGAKQ